jgi:DNA-binding transcriptional MerR regulator
MALFTMGALQKQTGISAPTLRHYADAGWIECEIDSTGRRLFTGKAVRQAISVYARRNGKGRSA